MTNTTQCDQAHVDAVSTCVRIIGGQTPTYIALELNSPQVVGNWIRRRKMPAEYALSLHEAAIIAAAKKNLPLSDVPDLKALLTCRQAGAMVTPA